MKRCLKRIFMLMILLPVMLLSSCIRIPGLNTNTPKPSLSPSIVTDTASPSPSPAPTDWHSGVKTDYSGLTPYKPLEEKYTRLKDGAMPELVPDHYGRLMPYVGETMYADGGWFTIRMYGLMTDTGTLVTDPVYSGIYQGSYYNYSTYSGENVPVLNLERLSEKIDKANPWNSDIHAACALDGSWITPFDYSQIFFTDKVIMLVRNEKKNDIDIMDYSGEIIYNTKSLGCYSDIPDYSAYMFQTGYGEGVIAMALSTGRTVYIDALTGSETYLDYTQSSAFSSGLAAVMQNDLYGYIDKSFNTIIPPQFIWADYFQNGKSVVQYPDNTYAVIDAAGNTLLNNRYYMGRWDSSTYGVYDANNNVTYFDRDLKKIVSDNNVITPLYDGWFYYTKGDDVTVFKGDKMYTFEDVTGVNFISHGLAVVYKNNSSLWQEGLVTLDGKVVVPMANNQSIYLITSKKSGESFAIASSYNSIQSFKVYNTGGEILFSGNGYASFNTQYDMFEVNEELSFAYVDTAGRDVFRISLMQYVPD